MTGERLGTTRHLRRLFADRGLTAVIVLAVTARLAFVLWAARGAPSAAVLSDQLQYWSFGHQVAAGNGYRGAADGAVSAYYPPGWPMMIAAIVVVTRTVGLASLDVAATVAVQVALGVAAVWLVFRIAERLVGRGTALCAAAVVALLPSLVFSSATFSVESAFIASYLAALAVLVGHDWSNGAPSTRRLVVFGAVIGLSAQIRPFSLPMLVGLPVAVVVAGLGRRVALRSTIVAAATAAAMFVPWTVRNAVQMDAFLPSSTNLGDTMCMSRFPGSDGGFRWATHEWCADPDLPEVERNTANIAAAVRFVRDHPTEEARQVVRRFRKMMANDHTTLDEVINNWGVTSSSRDRLPALAWTADIAYWVLLAFAAPGTVILACRTRGNASLAAVGVALASLVVIPLGLWGATRFHLPFLPLLAIPAATSVVWLRRLVGQRTAS